MVQIVIAEAARPELMQAIISAATPKIGANKGTKRGVTAGNVGRGKRPFETRYHFGVVPVWAAIASASEESEG